MGYIRHNAIIATVWQPTAANALAEFARSAGAEALVGAEQTNGYVTVCITPDGSKEGWQTSHDGDDRRKLIREWMESAHNREKDALYFEWVEVAYGSDGPAAEVVEFQP